MLRGERTCFKAGSRTLSPTHPPPPPPPQTTGDATGFVPMHWCVSSLNLTTPSYVDQTWWLNMNEPNNLHNCNKSPAVIAAAWGGIMAKWPSSNLVSPATAGDGRPWFDAFFGNCTMLYGPTGCNISAIAVHDYSCNAADTLAYLEDVHKRYTASDGTRLPVWLTEFSCGDGAANKPTADHLKYMKEVVPLLDRAPFVARYAWMSAVGGGRGLYDPDTGALTVVGELYNTV